MRQGRQSHRKMSRKKDSSVLKKRLQQAIRQRGKWNTTKHEKMFNPTTDGKTHIKTMWGTLDNTRLAKGYSGSEMWKNLQHW